MIQQFTTQLIFKKELASSVWLFRFKLIEPENIEFVSGQYLITKIPTPPNLENLHFYRRHFSIATSSLENQNIELIVQMIEGGIASTYYKNLNLGDKVILDGPAGVFTLKNDSQDKIFLATGTGIAPVRSILLTYLSSNFKAQMSNQIQSSKFYLFWGLRAYEDVYFFDELKDLAEKNSNFKFKICLSKQENFDGLNEEYFRKGRINSHLADFFTDFNSFEYYISGDRLIVESLRQFVLNLGVIKDNVYFEKF